MISAPYNFLNIYTLFRSYYFQSITVWMQRASTVQPEAVGWSLVTCNELRSDVLKSISIVCYIIAIFCCCCFVLFVSKKLKLLTLRFYGVRGSSVIFSRYFISLCSCVYVCFWVDSFLFLHFSFGNTLTCDVWKSHRIEINELHTISDLTFGPFNGLQPKRLTY